MSKPASLVDPEARCDWLDKVDAAKYLRDKGFHNITSNTIAHAARTLKTLHEAKRVGKVYFWHTSWLDEWVESL